MRLLPVIIRAAVLCLALAASAHAQDDSCRHRTLPVSVLDEHGKPVVGLTSHDFSATVHGKPVQILSLQADTHSPRVVVVLDSSAGMTRTTGQWTLARAIAADALRVSPKPFRAGLIIFNDQVRATFPVTRDPQCARDALHEFQPVAAGPEGRTGGRTAVWDALKEAFALLDPPEFGDTIYLITDGEDTASKTNPAEIGALAVSRGVRLSVALFSPGVDFPAIAVSSDPAIFDIPMHSGGQVIRVESAMATFRGRVMTYNLTPSQFKELDTAIAALYAEVQFAMRMEIVLPEDLKKPTDWKLNIAAPKGLKIPWRLSYPTMLDACSPAPPAAIHP
jgi:hypothetical protein